MLSQCTLTCHAFILKECICLLFRTRVMGVGEWCFLSRYLFDFQTFDYGDTNLDSEVKWNII